MAEKREREENQAFLHTIGNRQFCGFVGWDTVGGGVDVLHKFWVGGVATVVSLQSGFCGLSC